MTDQNLMIAVLQDIYVKRVQNAVQKLLTPDTVILSLGIDSLAMSWIITDIEEQFGITIYGADIFRLKTISDLIALIKSRQPE